MAARKFIEEGLIVDGRRVGVAEAVIKNTYNINSTLLKALIFSRLVRADSTPLGKVYELSHDTLVAPILKAYEKRKITEERIAAETRAKEERKKIAFWAFISGIMFLLLLASLAGLYYALEQKNIADFQKKEAVNQTLLAENRAATIAEKEKVLEEINELIEAVEQDSNKIHEAADVLYHLIMYFEKSGIKIEEVMEELNSRKK